MPQTVLIVEDEPALLKVLKKKIQELGCGVLTAEDGEAALKIIKSEKLSLILLDVIMPKKNGFDVLQEMRLRLKVDTPVIVLSNLEAAEDQETGHNLGIVDYFIKSNVSLRNLMQVVTKILLKSAD